MGCRRQIILLIFLMSSQRAHDLNSPLVIRDTHTGPIPQIFEQLFVRFPWNILKHENCPGRKVIDGLSVIRAAGTHSGIISTASDRP